jgi:uncharacterized protein YjbI with pentapeptide repeats
MDRGEALRLLKGGPDGITEWNRRRGESFADLSRASFLGADLRGAMLDWVNLSRADLRGANLLAADLSKADLPLADLRMSDLRGADLRGADLRRGQLSEADLSDANLSDVDLSDANLGGAGFPAPDPSVALRTEANLSRANLSRANLNQADLNQANLTSANLSHANLREANLAGCSLTWADLTGARLDWANLRRADLREANLAGCSLTWADLTGADLTEANLSGIACEGVTFASVDLSEAKGLDSVKHSGPSTIGTDTLFRSKGKIPEAFLRGCGLTPWEALAASMYRPDLTPAGLADLQYQVFDAWTKGRSMINGCFISYSHVDATFVDKLRDRLYSEGVNVWLDRHDMIAGSIQEQVWRAIQLHHVVILVLSEDSVKSDWVENELDMARQKEKAEGRAVLCPVALDDAWKTKVEAKDSPGDPSRQLWRTLQQKVILDFSGWKTKAFKGTFVKLLRGLKTNYGSP